MRLAPLLLRWAFRAAAVVLTLSAAATALMFPYWVDPPSDETAHSRDYYARAYVEALASGKQQSVAPLSEKEEIYINSARQMADFYDVPEKIQAFVHDFGLAEKKVLEVGAGSGLLQDQVADYTGLDISPTASRFFHKPFVEASATSMPFPDGAFDGLWTIWVLEHIPNPERALEEMRRVVKPGGYLFLYPALDVSRLSAQGIHARPYSELDWTGKALKAMVPVAESKFFHLLYNHQVRILRSLGSRMGSGPSRFHFIKLQPNYEQYWEGDSDATSSFSNHELYLWFTSRGDVCVNCPSEARLTLRDHPTSYLIIRKSGS